MNVLIDCRSIRPGHSRGIEHFAYAVITALAPLVSEIVLDVSAPEADWYRRYFADLTNVRCICDPIQGRFARWYRSRGLRRYLMIPLRALGVAVGHDPLARRATWAARQRADVVFYPYHRDPPQHSHLPMVVALHAILPEYGPTEMKTIAAHVQQAQAVVVAWPHPLQDVGQRYPSLGDRLFMVPFTTLQNVVSPTHFDIGALGVTGDYLFYPAAIQPRKNHENLIKGYGMARAQGRNLPVVVCCGGGDAKLLARLATLADSLDVRDRFVFLGYVPEEAMAALYANCLGTVSSTRWEAGMATLQEGGYSGKPAACSDIPPARAHAEILALDVCFFDPEQPTDIAVKLVDFIDHIERYRASAAAASGVVKGMDQRYLGRCYRDLLSYAAGLSARPTWAPFLDPRAPHGFIAP